MVNNLSVIPQGYHINLLPTTNFRQTKQFFNCLKYIQFAVKCLQYFFGMLHIQLRAEIEKI